MPHQEMVANPGKIENAPCLFETQFKVWFLRTNPNIAPDARFLCMDEAHLNQCTTNPHASPFLVNTEPSNPKIAIMGGFTN